MFYLSISDNNSSNFLKQSRLRYPRSLWSVRRTRRIYFRCWKHYEIPLPLTNTVEWPSSSVKARLHRSSWAGSMSAQDSGRAPIIPPSKRWTGGSRSSHSSTVVKVHAKYKTRHRVMYGLLAFGALATIIFLVAMATTDWIRLDFPSGVYRNSSNAYVQRHVSGLFRLCRVEINNASSPVMRRKCDTIWYDIIW